MATPERHGLFHLQAKHLTFRYGILNVFDGAALIPSVSGHPVPQRLRLHFQHVSVRLLRSLDLLQEGVTKMERAMNRRSPELIQQAKTSVDVAIAAETAFNYLGIFLDDIGRVLPIALGLDQRDSLNQVKKLPEDRLPTDIRVLMRELDCANSWWKLGFARGEGARQRFVHYPDLLSVQGEKGPGDRRYKVKLYLAAGDSSSGPIDVASHLQNVLGGMCEWLDRLEAKMITLLAARLPSWTPPKECPLILLPVDHPKLRHIPVGFLYLPLCKGSAALPKAVKYKPG